LIADAAGTPAALSKGIPTTTSDPQEWKEGTLYRWSSLVLPSGMADDGMLMFVRHVKEYRRTCTTSSGRLLARRKNFSPS